MNNADHDEFEYGEPTVVRTEHCSIPERDVIVAEVVAEIGERFVSGGRNKVRLRYNNKVADCSDSPFYIWNGMMSIAHPRWSPKIHNPHPCVEYLHKGTEVEHSKSNKGYPLYYITRHSYCACGELIKFQSKRSRTYEARTKRKRAGTQ